MVDSSNYDLTELYGDDNTFSSFSKLLSGKDSYKTVKETKKVQLFCSQCQFRLKGSEKFCPDCGNKQEIKPQGHN